MLSLLLSIPAINAQAIDTKTGNFKKNYTLTGNYAEDIMRVAEAQIGLTNSTFKYIDAWCAFFLCDCARLANIPASIIPWDKSDSGGVRFLYNHLINECGAREVSSPERGDIVFYRCSSCGLVHVGLYSGNGYYTEGNVSSEVHHYSSRFKDANGHVDSITRVYVRPAYVSLPSAPVHTVSATDTLHSVKISWNAVQNADFYSIRLYDAAGNRIYLRDEYQQTSFAALLPVASPAGTYSAEVCAVVRNVYVAASERIPFTVAQASPSHTPSVYDAAVLGDKVYKVFDTPVTWLEARALAEQAGGRLAIVNSQEIQNCIQKMVGAYNGLFFLGAHGYYYDWVWSDGSVMSGYTNWDANKPDNWEGQENVLIMFPNGKWEDYPNDALQGYVAEFNLTGVSVEPIETPWVGGVDAVRQNLIVKAVFADGSSYQISDYGLTAAETDGGISATVTFMGQTASCVVQTAPTYLLSVYCEGNVSRPYGIFAWPKEGDVIKLSSFDFGLTEEEKAEYVFGRWDCNLGTAYFADPLDENTTFTMPAQEVTITKVYYHRTPKYSNAFFQASYGGTLYVYIADEDTTYTVGEEGLTLNLREGASIALYAVPWDFFGFSKWNTEDFWVQWVDTPDPGTGDWYWVPMQGYDTYLCAEFYEGPYIIDPSRALYLPSGLKQIDDEAFAGIPAKYYYVPATVTKVGHNAFPEGSVVYLCISNIPDLPLDAITGSGTYIDWEETDSCPFAQMAKGTAYTVLNVHGQTY